MNIKITKNDVIWSYLGKFFQIAAGIFVLPLILRNLSTEEVAIWYIFLAIMSFVNLMDFGLAPNITRHCSYIFSGAKGLKKEGVDINRGNSINYVLFFKFIASVKWIYRGISLIAFVTLNTVGTYYIYNVIEEASIWEILPAWIIFGTAVSFNLYYYYYTPLLTGRGKLMESNKSMVFSKSAYIIISYVLILNGSGLLGIAVAYLLGGVVNRLVSKFYFYDNEINLNKNKLNTKFDLNIIKILWYNSKKMGMISVSYFMMTTASTLIIGMYLKLEEVAMYGLTMQIMNLLIAISTIIFSILTPKLNMLAIQKHKEEFLLYSGFVIVFSLLLYVIGAVCIIVFGRNIIHIINADINLLSTDLLILIMIQSVFSINYSIVNQLISTHNSVPYMKSSIFTGIAIVSSNFLILRFSQIGLIGIIISPILVQSIYNYWKWPLFFAKKFNIPYFSLLKKGVHFSVIKTKELITNRR